MNLLPLTRRSSSRRSAVGEDPLSVLARRLDGGDRATRRRLRAAAGRPRFPVDYQPIVDLATGAVAAREALVRWQESSDGAPRPPAAFIPLAEEMGVIVPIGRQILHRACADAARWTAEGGRAPSVHVNVSPVELRSPQFVTGVRSALAGGGLPADRLVLELTASVVAADPGSATSVLQEVRELGVGIALDRFGSGPVSLESLRTLPQDWLKIGSSFVHDLAPGGTGRPFVSMILQLADSLGFRVVAEGIETRAQMSALRALGVGHGQGYFLGSPAACAGPAFPIDELDGAGALTLLA